MTDLTTKIKNEYTPAYTSRQSIIETKKKDLRLYLRQGKEEKIQNSLLYSTINTYAAMSYTDTIAVEFMGRELGDIDRAEILNQMAKFDYEEMGWDDDEVGMALQRWLFGVNIEVFIGWDDTLKAPIRKLINPLSWFPDPEWHTHVKNFRFMGFVVETTINNLKAIGWYKNLSKIDSNESKDLREVKKEAERRAFDKQDHQKFQHDEDSPISIYIHYTRVDWELRCVTLANNLELIIKDEKVELISQVAQKDPSKAEFPIALTYRLPIEWNPWGISIPDEIRDKQQNLTILDNLQLISQKEASIGLGYMFNEQKVNWDHLLTTNPFDVRMIPVDWDTTWAVEAIYGKWPSQSAFNIIQSLERDANIATGISSSQSGVLTDESKTATEINATQANSNLRQLFSNRITLQGRRNAWQLWYLSYQRYFSNKDKKIVRVVGTMRNRIKVFKRNDFITKIDPDIYVVNKAEQESKRLKSKADFFALLPNDLQDPDLSEVGKRMVKTKAKEYQGFDKDEIMAMYPKSADEMQAWMDVDLINEWEYVPVRDMAENHQTFITIYQNAEDTPAKYASIEARKLALFMQEKSKALQPQQPEQNSTLNQAQAQFSNAAIQQGNQATKQTSNIPNL